MITPDGQVKPWRDMTPEERFADQFRHFPTLLGRWRGGRARLWSYTVSHTTLTIRVERPGASGHLDVTCSADFISGPVAWENAELKITPGPDRGVIIEDRAAGLRVVAGTVTVTEHVPPAGDRGG